MKFICGFFLLKVIPRTFSDSDPWGDEEESDPWGDEEEESDPFGDEDESVDENALDKGNFFFFFEILGLNHLLDYW